MALDAGFVLGNGLQHLGDAVADVIPDHIPYYQKAQEHTHAGKKEVCPVGGAEPGGKKPLDGVDGYFQKDGGQPAQHARHHTQAQQDPVLGHIMQKGP